MDFRLFSHQVHVIIHIFFCRIEQNKPKITSDFCKSARKAQMRSHSICVTTHYQWLYQETKKQIPNKQSAISKDGVKTAIYVRVFTGDCANVRNKQPIHLILVLYFSSV